MGAGRRLSGVRLAAWAAELCGAAGAASLGLCGGRDKKDVERSADAWRLGWLSGKALRGGQCAGGRQRQRAEHRKGVGYKFKGDHSNNSNWP